MSLRDFIGERRTVEVAGRRFFVRQPTVRTFFLALELFGLEIGAIRSAAEKAGGMSRDVALALFLVEKGHARLGRLLATCVACEVGDVPSAVASSNSIAMALVTAVADSFDASRLTALLGSPESGGSEADVDDGSLLVIGCGERFHIDPFSSVMEWPVGVFCDVVKAFSRPAESEATFSGFIPDGAAAYKVGSRPEAN